MRKLPPTGTIQVAPSILSADFARLADDIACVEPHVQILHVDIMDGHFVPNLTIGPVVVEKVRPRSRLFFDVHLMITDPGRYAPAFARAGADGITFHLETVAPERVSELIGQLRDLDLAVGVSIKPQTPVSALEPILDLVDMVLLMTIEPGFGGQAFMPESLPRCRQLKEMLGPDQRLEVDGGINPQTTPLIVNAGADTLVAGSAVFNHPDPPSVIRAILAAAETA